jgi:hypothetical protein
VGKGDQKVCEAVASFLKQNKLEYEVKEEPLCDHFYVKSGALRADLSVYNTGKIKIGGPDSPLKNLLEEAKENLSSGGLGLINILPFEIDKFPETIKERIPECDGVIIKLIDEAIRAYKVDILTATAFLLGAASEKAVYLLIEAFGESIGDPKNKEGFKARIGKNKVISAKYEEFMASYKACKTKCPDPVISNDLEIILNALFHFYRITRNEVGHPQIVPNIDKGILLANLGQFITYLERIYGLIAYFKANTMVL